MTGPEAATSNTGAANRRDRASWPWLVLALAAMIALGTIAERTFYGERAARLYERSGATMGTTWHLRLALPDGAPPAWIDAIADSVQSRLDEVDHLMSTWDPRSELSRFNRLADTAAFTVSPATMEVLQVALDVGRASGGALDVTVGPLVAAWGFGAGAADSVEWERPSASELDRLRALVGLERLHLDPRRGTVSKSLPGLRVDVSAVAKGYALDRAAESASRMGASDFALEVGGEVKAVGSRPDGSAWHVAIETPTPGSRSLFRVIDLRDEAVATSGDYRNFVQIGGLRYGHILDPRTGEPVPWRGFSVSVFHRQAAWADAWATALSVLGPDEGLALAESQGISAVFVMPARAGGFEERHTVDLAGRL